ncbi:hypothetical protein DAA51_34060 [Bradyrhizobium sp. WBAH10]|nr:hypothetical protein [Bradyrhizobium sp. WBAH30]MDD1545752.1 hypothetical protein [Bradyrhizobium sp. WBAH41]MDD1558987.1 hypothetical protein [Bradyrhizobium sp. WBAH23]MDD1566363.1 hypothetical protein [Bradyrhizobium sp. WBAH33]MDD1591956.1 hypothetical protein [Bradyrhizobium sp. WBAH42]NRB90034.1 hypothetical protein [Bradyrhizobium sp. WBAH10]QCJ92971.1 hypothetical protein DAA57_34305 [Bradyrhizobium yuanmingense]
MFLHWNIEPQMKDMQARLEKLKRDAAECALIRDGGKPKSGELSDSSLSTQSAILISLEPRV